jgi:putative transposase
MSKPQRLAGFDYRGQVRVFFTCATHERHRAFEASATCDLLLTELLSKAKRSKIAITAYCVMPDHVHLLLTGVASDSDVLDMMSRWKQASGYWYSQNHRRRLWQGNYYDHVLRDPDTSLTVSRYIVRDPLRTGLVSNLDDYKWWGSENWSRAELLADTWGDSRPDFWFEAQ